MKNSNGLPPLIGMKCKPVIASFGVIPTLPSFNSGNFPDATNRYPALASRADETLREHRIINQRYQHEQSRNAMAKADARRGAIGNLLLLVFVVLSCSLAAVTLRVEQQQQQQLERLR
jgi:hypothetical protein